VDDNSVSLSPRPEDIDQHLAFQWFDARISRYHTVENRMNDQQPPDDLSCVAALTLGLVSALPEASEELSSYRWPILADLRRAACCTALAARVSNVAAIALAKRTVDLAALGLRRRKRGEEQYLAPLICRLEEKKSPADEAAALYRQGGVGKLVKTRSL